MYLFALSSVFLRIPHVAMCDLFCGIYRLPLCYSPTHPTFPMTDVQPYNKPHVTNIFQFYRTWGSERLIHSLPFPQLERGKGCSENLLANQRGDGVCGLISEFPRQTSCSRCLSSSNASKLRAEILFFDLMTPSDQNPQTINLTEPYTLWFHELSASF